MSQVNVCEKTGKEVLVRSEEDEKNNFSFLDVIKKTDNIPENYLNNENFINNNIILQSHDNSFCFGYMLVSTYNKIISNETLKTHFNNLFMDIEFDETYKQKKLVLKPITNSNESYNGLFENFALAVKESMLFECTKGWRNEKYTVHTIDKKPYFMIERAMVTIFGILTFGIHVNGFFYDSESKLRMWIPRRSKTKATWPLKLDNVVAGGLGNGDSVDKTLWKELKEEANLDKPTIENNIKMVGCLSYFYFSDDLDTCKFDDEKNVLTSELEFIYDLEFPTTVIPKINDSEVHEFKHYSLQELVDLLKSNDFKPNCSLVVVDFLVRHGYINVTNEPNYTEILLKTHRRLPFNMM
ncbi:hypothetical protein ACO0SA_002208 [Hanseniaspora valbyensis]